MGKGTSSGDVVHYDDAQAVALAELSLDRSIPVYALFISTKELDEKASRLAKCTWLPVGASRRYTNAVVVLTLTSTQ